MDALLQEPPRARFVNVLFDEDFDVPEAAPEPEVIEAVFSASEMAGAREAAWRAGHAAGVQEVGANFGMVLVATLMVFATWNDLVHMKVISYLRGLFS